MKIMKQLPGWVGGFGLLLAVPAGAADKVDFVKQIRPIFAASCYKCHAGDKHKGDLKLDSVEAIKKGGKGGNDLVPGDAAKSDIYRRVALPVDDDDHMPSKGDPLTKEQTELLKQWITEGASFGEWKADAPVATTGPTTGAATQEAEGPKEPPLPQVPVADAAALDKLRATGASCMQLAQDTNLITVDFHVNSDKVTDAELGLLAPVAQQVYALNLAGTKVTDEGLKNVEGLKNLRQLHLERTQVGDAGLAHLKGLENLIYLNLYGTAVTDAGLAQFNGMKNLRRLYLWQSKVTEDGAEHLKKAMPDLMVNLGWQEPKPTTAPAAGAPAASAAPAK